MEEQLQLTDLIDVATLQRIQDAFAALTGMASLTTDANGIPVTKGSNFTDFCMEYVRKTDLGYSRCAKCDRYGARATWGAGKPTHYYCHAGLIDYAAPILAANKMVGSFIGGQVLTEPPNREKIEKSAAELGLDPEKLWEAAQKVRIVEKEDINHGANFLFTVASVLSDMAYSKHAAIRASEEIERAANMKSDFLANMSHEIRTPMNAVIGMAEMALREDLPPTARDYIHQIKAAGNALLTIINDILDFSKIESGKMEIIPAEYETMSIINDVANIVVTRLREKDVELILDVSPDIPEKLLGDNIRVKQILLNIANNAVKFTDRGQVVIKMSHTKLSEQQVLLEFSVQDTGIGIKEEDFDKIFNSFQQLDSKRNRNIEGTGLGLAISQQLLHLMGGNLDLTSKYGEGSTFSFLLPQLVVDGTPSSRVKEPDKVLAAGLIGNSFMKKQLKTDCGRLGVEYRELKPWEGLEAISALLQEAKGKTVFLFIEQSMFSKQVEKFIQDTPSLIGIVALEYNSILESNIPNLLMVKKPLFTFMESLIFNKEGIHLFEEGADSVDINFIAPEAEVLIVDDNAINLTVAEGLLEPLKMKIDTALSGKEAIGKISVHHYDLVFMDHMMPEIDGVETTHVIRRLYPDYNDVPIIALTANAMGGVKEMFLSEGMNDFVPKPIELRSLIAKVKQWLPVEKIQERKEPVKAEKEQKQGEAPVVGNLDTETAVRLLGGEKLFWMVLKDYYRVIEKKSALIEKYVEEKDWAAYTIEVHALKSSSRQIGAMALADKAAALEMAGNARDTEQIRRDTPAMLEEYRSYLPVLAPWCREEEAPTGGAPLPEQEREKFFASMREALDNLDIDGMEEVIEGMKAYRYEGRYGELFSRLKEAVENIDTDACEEILSQWEA